MKKILLTLSIILCANIVLVGQEDTIINNIKYTKNNNNTITASKDGTLSGNVIILDSVTIENVKYPVTTIGSFKSSSMTSITIPATVTSITNNAFESCTNLVSIICLATTAPSLPQNNNGKSMFKKASQNKTLTIPFNSDYSSWINHINANITMTYHWIRPAEEKELLGMFTVNSNTSLINEGVLKIKQGGQLINETDTNVSGIFEVETTNLTAEQWHLIGLPFTDYKLETLIPSTMELSILEFDYSSGLWSEEWATIDTEIKKGESFIAYSWCTEPTTFTNFGDIWNYLNNTVDDYNFNRSPAYQLNNGDITVSENIVNSNEGYWMALANPYTFKLNGATFLSDQENIQGQVYYRLNGDNETWTVVTSGEINVTEGFFVNFTSGGEKSAIFKKSQRLVNSAKSSNEREFVKLAMIDGEREVEVLFAHNEEAEEGYDIFDANKLFSMSEVTEPYFVTEGKALVKEEAKTLPYYATMNVRSFENKEVSFKLTSLPEGIAVSLIDGEEIIDLNGDIVYTTNITAGENANRFKVLFKKSVGLSDVEDLNIEISNNNRIVNVSSTENNLQIEVYNALGQRVYETKARNFSLNDLTAGAYIVKAFNKSASKTTKIVIQ